MTLQEYLEQNGLTPYAFFKKHGLPRDPIYRYLRGAGVKYQTAEAISKATDQAVTIPELMSTK